MATRRDLLLGAIDEALESAAWEQADHRGRRAILARAICEAFADETRPPTRAALDAALARADRDPRIRALRHEGLTVNVLASRFNLSPRQVRRICADID